ncbi:MAG: GNAT family N-acetyltransferase [Clostridia bacterium]|nr:GNAT family N-acetyltransferase [Clostridia bacterium]
MIKLDFREIDKNNFYDIVKLSETLTPEQKDCVASNAYSIAEGSVHSYAYYRGIYADDKPVGFFMLLIPNEETKGTEWDKFCLWRFMIAYDEQNKHYGIRTLDHIVELAKKLGHKAIETSCHMGDVSPYKFYLKYGFIDTKVFSDGEQVLLLKI